MSDIIAIVNQLQIEKEMRKKMMLEPVEGEYNDQQDQIAHNKLSIIASVLIIMFHYIIALRKLNNPVNIAKTFSDVGVQFDYSVPVARMLTFVIS